MNCETGICNFSNNFNWYDVDVVGGLKAYFPDIPIITDNDANAAAYGEFMHGVGCGSKSFVMITMGTGVGGGIVIND